MVSYTPQSLYRREMSPRYLLDRRLGGLQCWFRRLELNPGRLACNLVTILTELTKSLLLGYGGGWLAGSESCKMRVLLLAVLNLRVLLQGN
jgi:hypothetical protein